MTIVGETETGNGLFYDGEGWGPAEDMGQQGFAFVIEGEVFQMEAPQDLHVRDGDLTETLYSCGGPQSPIPEFLDLNPTWRETYLEGPDLQEMADGYQHQLYSGANCDSTLTVDEIWSIANGAPEDGLYSFLIPSPTAGSYCWRVRGWSEQEQYIFDKLEGNFFGDWSSCCCFVVGCQTLRTPSITAI